MEEITLLKIIRISNNTWMFEDNTMPPNGNRGNDAYSGTWNLDLYTLKSKTGAIIYDRVSYENIEYIDEVTPANSFNPSSCRQLHLYLKSVGFFADSNSGGGSTDIALTDLVDALFPNYIGRDGQILIVNEDASGFTTTPYTQVQSIEDLNDVPPIVAGAVLVGSTGGQTQWIPTSNLAIPFLPFKQQRIKYKGYIWNNDETDVLARTQNIIQTGDIVEGWVTDEEDPETATNWYVMTKGRYITGDKRALSSYQTSSYSLLAFETEPNY